MYLWQDTFTYVVAWKFNLRPKSVGMRENDTRYPCTPGIHAQQVSMHSRYPCTAGIHAHQVSMHTRYPCTPGIHAHQVSMHSRYPCTPGIHAHQVSMHSRYPCTPGIHAHQVSMDMQEQQPQTVYKKGWGGDSQESEVGESVEMNYRQHATLH